MAEKYGLNPNHSQKRISDRGRESFTSPSLRTVRADLPHTALRLARIFHEYLIRKHINNLLCNQSVFLLETLFCAKLPPDPHL